MILVKPLIVNGVSYYCISSFHPNDWVFKLLDEIEVPYIIKPLTDYTDGSYNLYVEKEYYKATYELLYKHEFGVNPKRIPELK